MRRLTILLATVAAFLLVPVAQAVAAETLTVNITGSGSGEINSVGGYAESGYFEGTPPIECSGPPPTGTCVNSVTPSIEEEELAEGFFGYHTAIALHRVVKPGSEFTSWTIVGGAVIGGCEPEAEECLIGVNEGEDLEVTATFTAEGPIGPVLTVTKEGTGSGTVVSSPGGIVCGSECSKDYLENTIVTLTASPAAGSTFSSWKKCDAKTETTGVEGRKCKVKMSEAKTVGAKFSPTYDVTVKKATGNTGLGSVSGVICDTSCTSATASFLVGKSVTLKPKAYKGSEFTGWTGCPEVIETVNCKVSAAATVEAKFSEIAKLKLTVNKSGGGQGFVKSKPSTINCGLTCSTQASLFYKGTSVELTASVTAGKGSTFTGFTGGTGSASGCSTSPCIFTIEEASSVTAKFE